MDDMRLVDTLCQLMGDKLYNEMALLAIESRMKSRIAH
jgi:hypothetical protein